MWHWDLECVISKSAKHFFGTALACLSIWPLGPIREVFPLHFNLEQEQVPFIYSDLREIIRDLESFTVDPDGYIRAFERVTCSDLPGGM